MSDQNKHAAEAQDIITANAGSSLGHETADAQHIVSHIEANTQAALALAYEQRTANLITLWTDPNANESPMNDLNYGVIAAQIKERLGL